MQSDSTITICMEQSISQSPQFLYPIRGVQCSVGNLFCLDAKWTWTGSHDSCVISASVACQSWAKVDLSLPENERNHGRVPGHLYESWPPQTDSVKQTLHTVLLIFNHLSQIILQTALCINTHPALREKKGKNTLTVQFANKHPSVVYVLSEETLREFLFIHLTQV